MNFITTKIQAYRTKVDALIGDFHQLTTDIGHAELAKTVSELRQRIHEPFLFVIAGEVKAGKSSFINALLATGKEICKVAAQPMTDTIQLITYGDTEEVVTVNPYLKKVFQPVEILKEIAIVDTPGTNTIVAHHQEITEGFIPSADLIVFVFEAKNPYRQSAWDFFNFIHTDWRRKIIFILQQKDLMLPEDLATNTQGVIDEGRISETELVLDSLRWDAVLIRHDVPDIDDAIEAWFAKWFDPDELRFEPGNELSNCIHAVHIGSNEIEVDLGTAPTEAFWQLLTCLAEANASTLNVRS